MSATKESTRPHLPSTRSRGQLARRNSTSLGSANPAPALAAAADSRAPRGDAPGAGYAERPLVGGLYFSDLVVVAFFYALNLVRTLGIAELADVVLGALAWAAAALPRHVWARCPHRPLSPFHHLVILLARFACARFPHLLPRVLLAEDTIGPLVRWRTGGGAAGLVREFGPDPRVPRPIRARGEDDDDEETPASPPPPAFRAFWIGTDAHVPPQVRREREAPDPHRPPGTADRAPTTILYLHGGGFSLGSVAFYAEALIRVLGKICLLEHAASARCVAVEYDLAPAPRARFPAPLLQCLRCYAHLVEVERIPPASITLAGDSAGANLAMGLLLCLHGGADVVAAGAEDGVDVWAERDWSELPMPGQAVLISPWADLRPGQALTFASLRGDEAGPSSTGGGVDLRTASSSSSSSSSTETKLRTAIAAYEWDYVLPETLLHFAQVYTGVMEVPRRVRGPVGWMSHVCGVVGEVLARVEGEGEAEAKGRGGARPGDAEGRELARRDDGDDDDDDAGSGGGLWAHHALRALGMLGIAPPTTSTSASTTKSRSRSMRSKGKGKGLGAMGLGALARVPRRWTLALKEVLDEPLFGFGPGFAAGAGGASGGVRTEEDGAQVQAQTQLDGESGRLVPGRAGASSTPGTVLHPRSAATPATAPGTTMATATATTGGGGGGGWHGLAPLFSAQERRTDAVGSTAELFVPFARAGAASAAAAAAPGSLEASGSASTSTTSTSTPTPTPHASTSRTQTRTRTRTAEEAARLLETNPLISPAIADWSAIRLERGMLVTWGERERLAADIERWVGRVRSGAGAGEARRQEPKQDKSKGRNPGDGGGEANDEAVFEEDDLSDAGTEKGDRRGADWLHVAVEHGPGGVHAWPFVSMYLAGTEAEREKGLELLARFIAQEPLGTGPAASAHVGEEEAKARAAARLGSDEARNAAAAADADADTFDSTPDSFSSSAGSMPSDAAPYGEETDEASYGPGADAGLRTSLGIRRAERSTGGAGRRGRVEGVGDTGSYFPPQHQHHHTHTHTPTHTHTHAQGGEQEGGTAYPTSRPSPAGTATTDSSEGSSSPEGRVTALGGSSAYHPHPHPQHHPHQHQHQHHQRVHGQGYEHSQGQGRVQAAVGLGFDMLPPPLQLQIPGPAASGSPLVGGGGGQSARGGSASGGGGGSSYGPHSYGYQHYPAAGPATTSSSSSSASGSAPFSTGTANTAQYHHAASSSSAGGAYPQQCAGYAYPYQTVSAPCYFEEAQRHERERAQAQVQVQEQTQERGRAPGPGVGGTGLSEPGRREMARSAAEEAVEMGNGDDDEEEGTEGGSYGLEDIEEVSEGTFSPDGPSSPSTSTSASASAAAAAAAQHFTRSLAALPVQMPVPIPSQLGFYGFSHYTVPAQHQLQLQQQRMGPREPEGLSDITEEGSVLSGSVRSGASSPSPVRGAALGLGLGAGGGAQQAQGQHRVVGFGTGMAPPPTLGSVHAAQVGYAHGSAAASFPMEYGGSLEGVAGESGDGGDGEDFEQEEYEEEYDDEEEDGEEGEEEDEDEDEQVGGGDDSQAGVEEEEEYENDESLAGTTDPAAETETEMEMAFSPPAAPQPGPSLPTIGPRRAGGARSGVRPDGVGGGGGGGGGGGRKKPKGDVWW